MPPAVLSSERSGRHRYGLVCALATVAVIGTNAEQGILVVSIRNAADEPLSRITVGTVGDGSTGITDATGRARLRLPNETKPGSTVTLQVVSPANLFMVSPWGGRAQVPSFDNSTDNYVQAVLIARGDRRALENAAVMSAAVAESVGRTPPAPTKPSGRGSAIHGGPRLLPVGLFQQSVENSRGQTVSALITDEVAAKLGFSKAELVDALARLAPDPLLWKLILLTGIFETGNRDPFTTAFGDFDGQGISFGIGWWNVRRGTLQPLLKEMRAVDPQRFDSIMGDDSRFVVEWLEAPLERGLEMARSRILGNSRGVNLPEPWRSRFAALGSIPVFQRVQLKAMAPWLDGARKQTAELGLRSERALAFVYDWRFNQGPIRQQTIADDQRDRQAFVTAVGRQPDEQERLVMLTNRAVLRTIASARSFVRRRRLTFALGTGQIGGITVHLESAGFGMRDLTTGEPMPLVDDAETLKRLLSGWVPGPTPGQ